MPEGLGPNSRPDLGEEFAQELPPTAEQVLNFIALKNFQSVDPSKPEELNGFLQYLRDVLEVLFVGAEKGSLIIVLECRTLEILEGLWEDYNAGHINEVVQKYLITDDILEEFGEVKLTTTIPEDDYRACRDHFLRFSGKFK